MDLKRYKPIAVLVAIVVVVQLIFSLTHTNYYLTQLTMSAYYSVVVIGLCLLMGYAGQVSLGHAGFFAIGGYSSAVMTTYDLTLFQDHFLFKLLDQINLIVYSTDIYGIDKIFLSPFIAFAITILITLIIAFLIGIPVIKLKGHYLAMATLGFGIIIFRIVLGTSIFGEADGISDIPAFKIFGPVVIEGSLNSRVINYYIAWALVLFVLIISINLIHSRIGRAMRAIHSSEEAARAMGINVSKYKFAIFILSALFASVAGIMLTHYNGGIGPSESSIMKSVRYVAIVAVGGMANIWGALLMAIILNFLSLRGYFGTFDDAIFGLILIGIMLFAPDGLLKVNFKLLIKKIWKTRS